MVGFGQFGGSQGANFGQLQAAESAKFGRFRDPGRLILPDFGHFWGWGMPDIGHFLDRRLGPFWSTWACQNGRFWSIWGAARGGQFRSIFGRRVGQILSRYILAILGANAPAGGFLFSAGTFWPLGVKMYGLGVFYSKPVHVGHFWRKCSGWGIFMLRQVWRPDPNTRWMAQ